MTAQKKPNGYIVYRGPSLLDGSPIVAVAIVKSENAKTGNRVQTYILVDNGVSPLENARSLADAAICGDCPERRGLGGACYVNLGQGPRAVADGVVRGIYPENILAAMGQTAGRMVRMGTYGDPAAVPEHVWRLLLTLSSGRTGYTHQWKQARFGWLKEFVMASAGSAFDRWQAKEAGWRTFRVRTAAQEAEAGEFVCPASEEAGKRTTCVDCGACDGVEHGARRADPVIVVHGSLASRFVKSIHTSL